MTLEDIYRLLRSGHVQAQGIVDTIDQPLLVLDEALCVVNVNPAFLTTFHVSRDDTISRKLCQLGNGQWNIPALIHLLEQVIPKATAVVYEVTHDFPDIGRKTMLVTARRLIHPDSNSINMLLVIEDVTERRREESGKDLLAREIEHRLKNFMAMVMALAQQIPAEGEGAARFRDALLPRLEAMTKAELGLFSREDGDLASILTTALAANGDRIRLDRAHLVKLRPAQVRSFSLLLHELATNAIKYGSLSVPKGTVRVGWHVTEQDGRKLFFTWKEEGGPPVAATAAQDGFGSRLIQALAADLGGTIEKQFDPSGLQVSLTCPLAA